MKKTPWFSGEVKPVRVGVYERDIAGPGVYAHWNGERWGEYTGTVPGAFLARWRESVYQLAPWRGLTKPAA